MIMHTIFATLGFPLWLRLTHYINLLFIGLLIRSGIQILAAHPRLYWREDSNPDRQWIKFTTARVPKDTLYTSMDDENAVSPIIALPGGDNLGLGRLWHFFAIIFWVLNGVIYVVLLFTTGEWSRLIPTSWSIFPDAWRTLFMYLSFHIPPTSAFHPYDPLQQLSYAGVVFILVPFMFLTGAAMSPSIEGRFPWYVRLFGGKQAARSLHFLSLVAFLLFIIVHTALVLLVRFQDNIRNIVFGTANSNFGVALTIAIIALVIVAAIYIWASWYSLRKKRQTQRVLRAFSDPVERLMLQKRKSKQHYRESDISSYFWVNGYPPETEEYEALAQHNFKDYRLEVDGLVGKPMKFSLEDLRNLPRQKQITLHNCIQGWSGIAEWSGVPLTEILKLCEAKPDAKYVVFMSYQLGKQSVKAELTEAFDKAYYEVLNMELATHPQTILAYEMNGEPLPIPHGAPLRLRVETLLGYKMVKYLRSIELVADYSHLGEGQGGFREDFQYYGKKAEI
jgi:DMSO/TMAO reductase YedYZ molybdopterin-dependent catalytic subunit/thiosulfate reductase cytochrome b subunit